MGARASCGLTRACVAWPCRDTSCTGEGRAGPGSDTLHLNHQLCLGHLQPGPPTPAHSCLIYGAGSAGWSARHAGGTHHATPRGLS